MSFIASLAKSGASLAKSGSGMMKSGSGMMKSGSGMMRSGSKGMSGMRRASGSINGMRRASGSMNGIKRATGSINGMRRATGSMGAMKRASGSIRSNSNALANMKKAMASGTNVMNKVSHAQNKFQEAAGHVRQVQDTLAAMQPQQTGPVPGGAHQPPPDMNGPGSNAMLARASRRISNAANQMSRAQNMATMTAAQLQPLQQLAANAYVAGGISDMYAQTMKQPERTAEIAEIMNAPGPMEAKMNAINNVYDQGMDLNSQFAGFSGHMGHRISHMGDNLRKGMSSTATKAGDAFLHERERIREGHFPFLLAGVVLMVILLLVDHFIHTFLAGWQRGAIVLLIISYFVSKIFLKKKPPPPPPDMLEPAMEPNLQQT